jgi:hypothetical protein
MQKVGKVEPRANNKWKRSHQKLEVNCEAHIRNYHKRARRGGSRNPGYSGGRDQKDYSSRPAHSNS